MRLRITCDENEESGVGEVINEISGPTRKHFAPKDYGIGLHGLGVVLMCRNPEHNFKRRLRFSKKDKVLYMDIMLELNEMKHAEHIERKQIIAERLIVEVPAVLRKYSFPDFDEAHFVEDFTAWLDNFAKSKTKSSV